MTYGKFTSTAGGGSLRKAVWMTYQSTRACGCSTCRLHTRGVVQTNIWLRFGGRRSDGAFFVLSLKATQPIFVFFVMRYEQTFPTLKHFNRTAVRFL